MMTDHIESNVVPVRWVGTRRDGHLEMLDQRRLPAEEVWLQLHSAKDVADGIRDMVIRGAPAIGIAAAYGMAIGIRDFVHDPMTDVQVEVDRLIEQLSNTRPTAVNLQWALDRARTVVERSDGNLDGLVDDLFDLAEQIFEEDRTNNLKLGEYGAELFDEKVRVLTHCNTGGLATSGYGTALGVIRVLDHQCKLDQVWIGETRPYLQGARLTSWECLKDDIDAMLITDSMAAHFIKRGDVDAVITGTDRVAANGDVANKIGTYGLAVLCDHHDIPFYIASPLSTIDLDTPTGDDIPIEQRSADEVRRIGDTAIAPDDIDAAHPAFDVTPAELVTAIITEKGVVRAPYGESLKELFG